MKERLQKVIAKAGVASRRKAEELIAMGKVVVNSVVVTELGTKVDLNIDEVLIDGKKLKYELRNTYLLNKPQGVICTNYDPQKRKRVIDMIAEPSTRLYTIGRLDVETRGLILVTNDGDLSYKMMHPKHEIEKTYEVELKWPLKAPDYAKIKEGVEIEGRKLKVVDFKKISQYKLSITICEGRKRIVRKLFQTLKYHVTDLKRTRLAFLTLKDVNEGCYRKLDALEVKQLNLL